MNIEWMLLAEGIGQDAKGALTLIGINQNVFVSGSLPAVTKRAVIAHILLSDEDVASHTHLDFSYRVESPSGRVLSAASGAIALGPKAIADLPVSADIPAELVLNAPEYGEHIFTLEASLGDGHADSRQVAFYILSEESVRNQTERLPLQRAPKQPSRSAPSKARSPRQAKK